MSAIRKTALVPSIIFTALTYVGAGIVRTSGGEFNAACAAATLP